ncbi:MAG: DNA polymerase III subunit delta [Rikenellaceae bacterium]
MRFADVIGNEPLKQRLREALREGRVPHCQLFSGGSGRGVLPLALAYIQHLNCQSPSELDSCGECPSCLQMEALSHPDLHIVMPVNRQGKKSGERMLSRDFLNLWRKEMQSSGGYLSPERWYEALELGRTLKGAISVDEADEVVRSLSFKSFSGGYKSMVIWLPEMMGEQAANKLLKVLEEPWDRTLFILVSEHPEQLLQTILSRAQQIEVPQIESCVMARYAQQRGVTDGEQLRRMVHLAGGDLLAMNRLLSGEGGSDRTLYFNLFTQLMRLSYGDRHIELLAWAEEVAQLGRSEQLAMLRYSMMMLREAYIRNAGLEQLCYTWGEEGAFCTKFAPYIGSENIEFLIGEIETALVQLQQSANATILFTHFALAVSKVINRL